MHGISPPASKARASRSQFTGEDSEGQRVRGPLTPRPGHLPLVRTGWGAPRWAACCGGALQGLEYLRVCSWGAAGLHVTVRGFISLDWAGVPSTGSCPCSFLRHPKSQSVSKLGPLTHSLGHRCVCTHVGTCVTHAYDHTCTHLDAHTHAHTHRSPTSVVFSTYLPAKFMVTLPDPEVSSSISFALPHFSNHLITSVFRMAIIIG